MLGHLLQVICEVASEVSNFVPHPGIRIERQTANGNPGNEFTSSGEKLFHQPSIFGEEQNIAHQASNGFRGRQLMDAVLRALFQKKQSRDRRSAVLAGSGQLSGKRGAECRVTLGVRAEVGNFGGKQGDVRWRQPRHRGFASTGYAREQTSPAIANRTGSVQQESTALGKNQAVQNAEHRIERIRVGILPHAASSGARVPASVEVSALDEPLVTVAADPNVVIGNRHRAGEIKLKLKLGTRRTQEPDITLTQQIEKAVVAGGQSNRDPSDLDTGGFSGRGHHQAPISAERISAWGSGFRRSLDDAFRRL